MALLPNPGKHVGENIGSLRKSKNITLLRQSGLGVRKLSVDVMKIAKVGISNFRTDSGGSTGIGFYWR